MSGWEKVERRERERERERLHPQRVRHVPDAAEFRDGYCTKGRGSVHAFVVQRSGVMLREF